MRVAFFEPFGNLYGSERSALGLLHALKGSIANPVVYCPANAPWLPELQRLGIPYQAGFETRLHEKSRIRRIAAFLRFAIFLLSHRIQIIHVNQFGGLPYALLAGKLLRIPVVLHSRWHEDPASLTSMKFEGALSSIVCISDYQFKLISDVKYAGAHKYVVLNPYEAQLETKPAPELPPRFVCPARLHPHKRQDLLVRATASYVAQHGSCSVHLIGEEGQGTGFESELRDLAKRLSVSQYLFFHGYQSDWMERAHEAVALVIPSEQESLGRVVFEAWDGGTVPIAWAGSGGPAETISASTAGILYADQTAEALAHAMHEAVRLSLERRAELVGAGRKWVQHNCAPKAHASKILGVWSEALKGRPAQSG